MNKPTIFRAILSLGLAFAFHFSAPAQTPKKVDLRNNISAFNIPIKTQGSRNTCSVYTTTFMIEYETAKASNQKGLDFSEDYSNAMTDVVKGLADDGDFFNNILAGYLKYGIVDEEDFPTNTVTYNANNIPSQAIQNDGKNNIKFLPVFIRENPMSDNPWGLTDEHINQIVAQLDAGRPVGAGWRLSTGMENTKVLGINAWSKSGGDYYGHSMPIVGYVKGTPSEGSYFIIRNSGGPTWGDKGYWYCTFEFAKQNIADAFYLKPRGRSIAVQAPRLVKRPVPSFIKMKQLKSQIVLSPKAVLK